MCVDERSAATVDPGERSIEISAVNQPVVVFVTLRGGLTRHEPVQDVHSPPGGDIAADGGGAPGAINAAATYLPRDLPNPPIYSKVNPADTPILTLGLTSDTLPLSRVEDLADTNLAQKISQLPGVGLVSISGGSAPRGPRARRSVRPRLVRPGARGSAVGPGAGQRPHQAAKAPRKAPGHA